MADSLLWLASGGPAALAGTLLVRADTRVAVRWASAASLLTLGLAVAGVVALVAGGPLATGTLGAAGIGLSLRLDALSATLFLLVAFVGWVVLRYSRNYLDGEPGQGRFMGWMGMTLGCVLLLVLSGNLLQLALAWVGTSVGLNRLLLFYPDRPAARLAARKKFIASRIGDLCLVGSMILAHRLFGSLDMAAIKAGATAMAAAGTVPAAAHGLGVLIVIAALLKSAQLPMHGWLLEVMETPTPVSALLHAGIINAGGFLVLRMADVVLLSPGAMGTLVAIGGLTALFGSLVMLTQTSVKVQLAYSTIAQMGFMMLQCGLGAFPAALLHIVAHSLYKAHAFLSSGSVIDLARASWTPSPGGAAHPARTAVAAVLLIGTAGVAGWAFGATLIAQPGVVALGAIMLLGLTHLIISSIDERPTPYVVGRSVVAAAGVAVAYFALQRGTALLTAGALPPVQPLQNPFELAAVATVVLGFAGMTIMQSMLAARPRAPRWQALHAHAANGFYLNTLTNRLVLRLWPARTATIARGA